MTSYAVSEVGLLTIECEESLFEHLEPKGRRLPQAGSSAMSGGRLSMVGMMCSRDVWLARLSLQADARAHGRRVKGFSHMVRKVASLRGRRGEEGDFGSLMDA